MPSCAKATKGQSNGVKAIIDAKSRFGVLIGRRKKSGLEGENLLLSARDSGGVVILISGEEVERAEKMLCIAAFDRWGVNFKTLAGNELSVCIIVSLPPEVKGDWLKYDGRRRLDDFDGRLRRGVPTIAACGRRSPFSRLYHHRTSSFGPPRVGTARRSRPSIPRRDADLKWDACGEASLPRLPLAASVGSSAVNRAIRDLSGREGSP